MKRIITALTPILLLSGLTMGMVLNNHQIQQLKAENDSDNIKNNDVSTILNQKVYYDDDDANPDLNGSVSKPITFSNQLKKIYLPNNYVNNIPASSLLMKYKQASTPTNDGKQCGYSNDNDNMDFELHDRIQDWAPYYFGNLSIKKNTFDNQFGLGIIPFSITNGKIWDKNTSYKTINNPIAYEKDNIIPTIFNNGSEFNYVKGVNTEFVNKLEVINGVPFCYTKESQHTSGMKIWANRYLWTLQGQDVGYSVNTHPVCGVYSLDNLISINGSSYQNNNIELGLNNVMLSYAKQLDQEHTAIKTNITDQIMENHAANIDEILELVDTNTLGEDNVGNLLNYIDTQTSKQFNYVDCFNWLRLNPSMNTPDITLAGFGPYDNPWIILSDIWNKLNLKIEYDIRDSNKPDQWVNKMEITNLSKLASGMEIPLNLSNQGKYEFKLINITSDTVNQDDSFVYSAESNVIANHDTNVFDTNNIYTLSDEQIADVNFNKNNPGYNQNYYPSEMTDELLFHTYVNLITNYGEAADFNILNKDQYRIVRNEVVGTINLNITIGSKIFENEYSGFKVMGQKIPDIDGSLDKFNIAGVDLSKGEIITLLELNHFNSYVANSLDYDVINDDIINGVATISVIGCNDPAIHDIYINQTFKINKLQPYFIQQVNEIDKSLYKISPANVTLDQFKNYFIKMSPEFQNRNLEDLQINLIPSTNALVGKISYTEGTNGEAVNLVYTYDGFAEHSSYGFIIWIVVGILGAAAIGIITFLLWKRFHKRDHHTLNELPK